MKKTSLMLVTGLALLFLLYGAKESCAVNAQQAYLEITGAQMLITEKETQGYTVPKSKEILEKAQQAYQDGKYKKTRKLIEKALAVLRKETAPKKSLGRKIAEKTVTGDTHIGILTRTLTTGSKHTTIKDKIDEQRVKREPVVEVRQEKPGVNLAKYQKIAVLKFKDASGTPGSGSIVADLVAKELVERKHNVVGPEELERAAREEKDKEPEIGKEVPTSAITRSDVVASGNLPDEMVDSILVKIQEDAKRKKERVKDLNYSQIKEVFGADVVIIGDVYGYAAVDTLKAGDAGARVIQKVHGIRIKTGGVYIRVEIIDAETGGTIWKGKGAYAPPRKDVHSVAQAVVKAILDEVSQKETQ